MIELNENFVLGMSNEDYHKHTAVSNTNLGWIQDWSPRHYRTWKDETPPDPTPAMIKGSAIHTAVLEPETYEERYVVYEGYKSGKKWEQFKEENENKTILTVKDDQDARATRKAVTEHPGARRLLEQARYFEASVFAEIMGISCKARLDILTLKDAFVDLKSSQCARPDKWASSIENYSYDRQAAFYHDVVCKALGEEYLDLVNYKWYWIIVESSSPYAVSVLEAPITMIHNGRQAYRQILEVIHNCEERAEWPCYSPYIMEAHYPKWSKKATGGAYE